MRTSVAAAAMAASLTLGGAAGAVLFVPDLSAAQGTEEPTTGTEGAGAGSGFLADALAPLVDDGTITQDQADEVIAAIREARPAGLGHHGHHGHNGGHPFGAALTEVLGIDAAALRESLGDGRTIAEIAEANGVAVDDVVAALVAETEEHLARAVENGRLTQEEADDKAAELSERITAMVNGEAQPGFGPGRHHDRRGPAADGPTDS